MPLDGGRSPRVEVAGWEKAWKVARPLMETHSAEFAIPDLVNYIGPFGPILEAEAKGEIIVLLAWAGPWPVGYMAWMIGEHQGLQGKVARLGPWYIAPAWRGRARLARLMLEAAKGEARLRGAAWLLVTLPAKKKRHGLFGTLFENVWLTSLETVDAH